MARAKYRLLRQLGAPHADLVVKVAVPDLVRSTSVGEGPLACCDGEASTELDADRCRMPMIRPTDTDFRVCHISFKQLLEIQQEAQDRGWATRWSSVEALRRQVKEDAVVLQSLLHEEREGAVFSYRCLALFSTAGGNPSGGLATVDIDPSRFASFERLDQDPDVSQAFARVFALASGGISMISRA